MNEINEEAIKELLKESHIIAVVGLSSNPSRDSYMVAKYLKERGYRIIPVNPKEKEILGEKSYPDLKSIPEKIDIVDVFRRPEFIDEIAEEAISVKAKALWMQKGIRNEEAAEKAHSAGLIVVQDRCMMVEYSRLMAA